MTVTTVDKYFDDLDTLDASLVSYIHTNLRLWDICGLLSVVERTGKRARLVNGKIAKERQRLVDERDLFQEKVTKAEQSDSDSEALLKRIRHLNNKIKELSDADRQDRTYFIDRGYIILDRQETGLENTLFNKFGSVSIHEPAYLPMQNSLTHTHLFHLS